MARSISPVPALCPAGGAHVYDVETIRHGLGHCVDRGVCRGCGAVKEWTWPAMAAQWRPLPRKAVG